MGIEQDPSPQLAQFARQDKLVSNAWLGAKLGTPGLKVVESNEDSLLYDIGHVPTAVRIKWEQDLSDPLCRDVLTPEAFAQLMDEKGISREDTLVIYGDHTNLWAVYTLWVCELFGHPDVRLLDGGRDAWMQEEREISYAVPTSTTGGYPVVERDDSTNRIFVDELQANLDDFQVIDLRDPEEFAGESSLPGMAISRHGHVPGAVNLRADDSLHPNSRFRTAEQLAKVHEGLDPNKPTVVYCNNGARAAQQWFVLKHLLGWEDVRVYDGSWVEWGNMIRVPIERG
ncbi:MAG TPA: sulfurtransferase [Candidatus Corynebacterium gallistercoris]|uniref:Sulfurtransferase n=1 Tax=Candidatus Corynebacterium gallistercoris TaxID=2838530 RepID=A0A9D1UQA1_9CORY|nr:sulfurtransferase [Candidatus Corynebacterium gallistercoris]